MNRQEEALAFACEQEALVGVVHLPHDLQSRGVLMIVGGPQYRAGSHRQFTLMARFLSEQGIPVMRFDYRGMGDSTGEMRTFEQVNDDVKAALDAFAARLPDLREVVLWGLCDAASAICFYAYQDPRVIGTVLVNPWVKTGHTTAKVMVRHYYLQRVFQPALWRKLAKGQLTLRQSLCDFGRAILQSVGIYRHERPDQGLPARSSAAPLPERMAKDLEKFSGNMLFILSGNDLTAREFEEAAKLSPHWRKILRRSCTAMRRLESADHTFSRKEWRDQVAGWTLQWLRSW